MTTSSIALMRKGRRKVADLGKAIGTEWGEPVRGIPGYLYEHGLYIEIDGRGRGVLTIANSITKGVSLGALEETLYDWAVEEGYAFTGASPVVGDPYGEILRSYRAVLDENPGTALIVRDGSVLAVADPDSDAVLWAEAIGGPHVIDVREVQEFKTANGADHWPDMTPEMARAALLSPRVIDLPEGFDETLRTERARAKTRAALTPPSVVYLPENFQQNDLEP